MKKREGRNKVERCKTRRTEEGVKKRQEEGVMNEREDEALG